MARKQAQEKADKGKSLTAEKVKVKSPTPSQSKSCSRPSSKSSTCSIKFTLSIILFSTILRILISLAKHSGQDKPPMYGDYEAQRHWQEITYNLPPIQWYVHNDKKNNLTYWGLDYPPLTAFHSYFNGWVADRILGKFEWVELGRSRGVGSSQSDDDDNSDPSFNPHFSNHKIFMRATVLFIDLIIFIFSSKLISDAFSNYKKANFILLANLPFLLMIDYAHFQYNCVSLGLFIGSLYCFLPREIMNSNDSSDHDASEGRLLKHKITDSKAILGAFLFMSSILYKQMNLYYSLPIFFYLLSKIIQNTLNKEHAAGFWLFFCLSTGVILSLGISFLPWLLPQDGKLLSQPGLLSKHDTVLLRLKQIFERVFPVGRGIFEDKVASFWCTINNVIKIKTIFDSTWLFRMALGATLGLAVPVCLHMAFVLIYCHEFGLGGFWVFGENHQLCYFFVFQICYFYRKKIFGTISKIFFKFEQISYKCFQHSVLII